MMQREGMQSTSPNWLAVRDALATDLAQVGDVAIGDTDDDLVGEIVGSAGLPT